LVGSRARLLVRGPSLPTSFSRADLHRAGFVGWQSWDDLRADDLASVPDSRSAYLIYRAAADPPVFLETSPAGRFKGKNPTAPVETLRDHWVTEEHVVYIGKANRTRRRLRQYARFGDGEPVGHWGGRYIWQLADVDTLLVAWHPITWTEAARDYERRLLAHFGVMTDGRRPFANLTG
jgi:hypothetical protein